MKRESLLLVGTVWLAGAVVLILSMGCKSSPTGTPGPVGPAWQGARIYQGLLSLDTSQRAEGTTTGKLMDDGKLAATIRFTWSTVGVGGVGGERAVFDAIRAHVVEYGDGYTCASDGAGPPVPSLDINPLSALHQEIRCNYDDGTRSSGRSALAIFGDGGGKPTITLKHWEDPR
ncbi:MAG: hypothetical protein ACI9WU_003063 [Myxococcota bacterium]|jgi:hypothetical protein